MARVAFIVGEDFEDSELRVPYDRLTAAHHHVVLVGSEAGKSLHGKKGMETIVTDASSQGISARDFDAVVIPGGYSPDHIRTDPAMVRFTREMFTAGKPVAAVCHAGSMLAEADIARGRTLTSWPSIKTDLINAGARWVNREVVEDGNLITSRFPDDLDGFADAIMRQLEGEIPERMKQALAPEPEEETSQAQVRH